MVSFVKAINAMITKLRRRASTGLAMAAVAIIAAGANSAVYADPLRLMVLGDSLVAGYGLPPGQGFPEQLEGRLREVGRDVTVINAGVSGDTTAGGVARLDWSLADNPQAVIIVLGGNDMLRGLPPEAAGANLETIISRLLARDIQVLLTGMMAPRNMGPAYVEAFDGLYPALAARHDIEFYPFFLDGVALDPALNLDDGLHPNEDGIAEISRRIMPAVDRLLARLDG